MILVAGATGNLGQAVVRQLIRTGEGKPIAVLARDEAKAKSFAAQGIETRLADYDDPASLPVAFAGVDTLMFISTMSMDRARQQITVVEAAAKAGVKRIVYTSLAIRDIATSAVKDIMGSHFETEAAIKASSMDYTILRNTMYADAIPVIVGPQALEDGILLPAGTGRVPYALREEMGEAAANVMLQDGHSGCTYDITGPVAYGYDDIARSLSAKAGYRLQYQDIPAEALGDALRSAGMPDFVIHLTLGTLADIKGGQYEIASRDLEQLLGREPASLDAMLDTVFAR